jgi:hypothetical protein
LTAARKAGGLFLKNTPQILCQTHPLTYRNIMV